MHRTVNNSSNEATLLRLVRASPLPVAISDLRRPSLVAVSESAAKLLGVRPDDSSGIEALALTDEPDRTREAITLMVEGVIDAYEARRRLRRADGTTLPAYVSVRHLTRQGFPNRALVLVVPHDENRAEDAIVTAGTRSAPPAIVGTTDPEWLIGRIRSRVGVVSARTEPAATPTERISQLEQALTRIVDEIQALGVAPAMAELPAGYAIPELENLSARQWEIVARLVRGERVPSIARSMFLSQSTVRNHLSAVYRKLGVRSQQELIKVLRRTSDDPSKPE